jgi:hypothetical protein
MLPKCRQHGLTYLPTVYNGHPGSSNFVQGPAEGHVVHDPTHRFQRACKIRPSTSRKPQNLRPPLPMFLFRPVILTLRAMVETPHTKTQTGCQMCDLKARDTHARADDGLSAPMLKVSPARFDIHLYRLDNSHQGSSNFSWVPKDQVHDTTHSGFNVQDWPSTSQNSKICGHLSSCSFSKFDLILSWSNGRDASYQTQTAAKRATYSEGDTHVCKR